MCTNYVPATRHEITAMRLGVLELPHEHWPDEIYPGFQAPIVVRGAAATDAPRCELAQFGLIPRWCKDASQARDMARLTYNARSETAAEKPSFRGPWQGRQWALAPVSSFFEPCWEDAAHNGNRAVRWQIARADAAPFALAGLWERWTHPQDGELVSSFTLLTVNADGHAVMGRMHRPGEEKRMPVVVSPEHYAAWLAATPVSAREFMLPFAADALHARPAPRSARQTAAKVVDVAPPQNLSLF